MRVLLVGPELEDNLTLRYLASSLRAAGHEAVIARFDTAADAPAVVEQALTADLVGLSLVFQSRATQFFDLAQAIRERSPVPIIAGGHFATCTAEPVLEAVPALSAVVLHEGERALVAVADCGADPGAMRQISGLVLRDGAGFLHTEVRPALRDLDSLPHPDRSGPVRLCAGVPTASILGSRGCLQRCDYCCITTLHALAPGPRLRLRSPEDIAREVAWLYHQRGIRQLLFQDDTFLLPRKEASLARLRAIQSAWQALGVEELGLVIKCRPDELYPEVLEQLVDMGLVRVFMGIESASDQGLASLGRRQSAAAGEEALVRCAQAGVSAQFTLMVFPPDATLSTLRADLAFMRRHLGTAFNFGRAEAYAGTPLEARVLADGRARGTWLAHTYTISDPVVERVSRLAVRIFHTRCWSEGSLLQEAIGLDHLAAVLDRFRPADARAVSLSARIHGLLYELDRDLVDHLEELVEAVVADDGARLERLVRQEQCSREGLHNRVRSLRAQVEALGAVQPRTGPRLPSTPRALMAAVASGTLVLFGGSCEYEGPPLEEQDTDGDGLTDDCERIYGTSNREVDSDDDGVTDPDEDHDGDGITNWEEQEQAGIRDCEIEAIEDQRLLFEQAVLDRFAELDVLPTGEVVDLDAFNSGDQGLVELVSTETGMMVLAWVSLDARDEDIEDRLDGCLVIDGPGGCAAVECDVDAWLDANPETEPCATVALLRVWGLDLEEAPALVDTFVVWAEARDLL